MRRDPSCSPDAPPSPPRCPIIESISSKKMVDGAWYLCVDNAAALYGSAVPKGGGGVSKRLRERTAGALRRAPPRRKPIRSPPLRMDVPPPPRTCHLARSKSTRTSFSESPRYLETMDEALMLKKVVLHSVATAFASMVLPVPGGP